MVYAAKVAEADMLTKRYDRAFCTKASALGAVVLLGGVALQFETQSGKPTERNRAQIAWGGEAWLPC